MDEHRLVEYETLRATIRERGTVRVVVVCLGVSIWAALVLVMAAVIQLPALALVPLLVLAATFEVIHALHVGAERVGRYLQVFHDDRWEATAMAYGHSFPGAGPDALFSVVFALATLVNLLPMVSVGPTPAEWIPLGLAHLLFILRIGRARRQSAGQRARDLARFRMLAGPQAPPSDSTAGRAERD